MKKLLLILVLSTSGACAGPVSQGVQKAQRRPMQRSSVVLESPKEYMKRTSGPAESLDPKPRVELVDAKAGKYALKWVGQDGTEKVIEYQRADAIDAVVSASVSKGPSSRYVYTYTLKNLPSSPTYLSGFVVQNFADSVRPVESNDGFVGLMSREIQEFKDGNWVYFGASYFKDEVMPGRETEVQIVSSAPPGLTGCRITGGELTLKGVGEHMPTELEDAMPGYEEWPRGYTIGPVDDVASFSRAEGVEYVLGRLPLFEQLGWMTPGARRWYGAHLKQDSPAAVLRRAEGDLQSEQITTEVYGVLRALKES